MPCLFATRSVFALMSNSSIASQRRNPFEKSATRSGSHAIGIGALKCASFLKPNWYHVQNFVVTCVSKWWPMIFFVRIFMVKIIKKLRKAV